MRRVVAAVCVFAFGGISCLSLEPLPVLPPGGLHVLFVGNSLTYSNDLPATVAAIAASAGDTVRVAMQAEPNLALIDHINGGSRAVEAIRQGGWHFVVLQQGPSTLPVNRDSLILWTQMFDAEIRAVNAVPALFMVWPAGLAQAGLDAVGFSYQQAAQAVGGTFLPAGEAWRSALAADGSLVLTEDDGYHPSAAGTFLAALTIYGRLTGRDTRTLPAAAFAYGLPLALPDSTIRLLQAAAHDAITRFP